MSRKGTGCQPVEARFWSRVDKRGPDECWPWTGATSGDRRYGTISHNGRNRRATQVSWEIANGKPFPAGLMACHTCDNPPCVNPAHIWPGTMSENLLDASAKGRAFRGGVLPFRPAETHCEQGHEFTPENTYRAPSRPTIQRCRICEKAYQTARTAQRAIEREAKVQEAISDKRRIAELEEALGWFVTHEQSLKLDVQSAHHSRGNGASQWMTEDDREFRSDLRDALARARSVLILEIEGRGSSVAGLPSSQEGSDPMGSAPLEGREP